MKFGEEFMSQMVPEWKEAYMDYGYLKSLLRAISFLKQTNRSQASSSALGRIPTLYRAFSGLTQRNSPPPPTTTTIDTSIDIENQVIIVNSDNHETMFLRIGEEGGECEMMYFKKLDDELNKVVEFYKFKVEEVVKEAQILNKQMEALTAFRIKVEHPKAGFNPTAEMNRLASDVAASAAALSATSPTSTRTKRTAHHDDIYEEGPSNRGSDEPSEDKDDNLVKFDEQHKPNEIKCIRPAPLEILNKLKMRNTHNTPRSTIKCILNVQNQTQLNFSKENLKKVEEQLKQAFIVFYQKLNLLKSFGFLNMLAFSKIMKKYNKVCPPIDIVTQTVIHKGR